MLELFTALGALLTTLNSFTPLGTVALMGVIILLLVHSKGPIQTLKNNHLEHVQVSLDKIADASNRLATSTERSQEILHGIKDDLAFLKGKLD